MFSASALKRSVLRCRSGMPQLISLMLLFGGLFGALTLFGLMAEDVAEGGSVVFDLPVMTWLHGYSSPGLDVAMRGITSVGSAWVVVPAVLMAAWCCRRQAGMLAFLLIANGGSALLNVTAKHAFERIRPAYWTPLVHETSYSFPSGHAMATMALLTSLWLLLRPGWRRQALLAMGGAYVLMVGISRIYLGVHYPSDVLAGWCAAFVWCRGLAMAKINE